MTRKNEVTRRGMLATITGSSALFLVGCGATVKDTTGSSSSSSSSASGPGGAGGAGGSGGAAGTGGAGGSSTAQTCVVTPEGEVGPYFTDDSASGYERSDIVANIDGTEVQEGIALTLKLTVVDTEKDCAPYVGAQIDIWHCNPSGVYSNESSESTLGESWLRGYQVTNAKGQVTFTTVIPGWYSGRTTHIHLRIRSTYDDGAGLSDGTNTTQLFFEQSFVDRLATAVTPYDAEGKNPTTNASDRVYAQQTDGKMQLTLTGDDTTGYIASTTIRLPIKADYDASAMGGGPGGGGMGPPGLGTDAG